MLTKYDCLGILKIEELDLCKLTKLNFDSVKKEVNTMQKENCSLDVLIINSPFIPR